MTIEGWFGFFLVEVSMLGILVRMAMVMDNEESPPPEGSGLVRWAQRALILVAIAAVLLVWAGEGGYLS